MITDKNLEQFEKWYKSNVEDFNNGGCFFPVFEIFDTYPFEMQIGVYLAYYDSLDIGVDVVTYFTHCDIFLLSKDETIYKNNSVKLSRNEAYKEALKKANDLINKE